MKILMTLCLTLCHVAIDTGFKQTVRANFLHIILMGQKIVTAFKCIFEETMPKLSVHFFRNHIS